MKNVKKLAVLLSLGLTFSCVDTTKQVITPSTTPSPSVAVSNKPTISPSTTPSIAITPQASASVVSTPSATSTPISNSTGITIIPTEKKLKFEIGMNNMYKNITSGKSEDYQKEINDNITYFNEIKPSFLIIDLEQKLVNPTYTEKDFSWAHYDKIFESTKNGNMEVFLKIKFNQIYNDKSSPSLSSYQTFLINFIERYQDSKISFIIGEKLNDDSVFSGVGTRVDFISFLAITYNTIKNKAKDKNIYLGDLEQSELFGTNKYKMIDDLLSFINLGADKYTDGFIFDIYSLATNVTNENRATILTDTNYIIIKDYYEKIMQLLKKKGLENKKLFLSTGTYGGDIIENVKQDPQQQANELIRQLIYSKYSGFDYVFLPKLFDRLPNEPEERLFNKFGLISYDNFNFDKKISYWNIKFLNDRLKGATLVGALSGLPDKFEGYVFEKEDKTKSYVIWSNDPKTSTSIAIPVESKNAKVYVSPTDSDRLSTPIPAFADEKGTIVLSFYANNTNPRIIELVK